MRYLFGEVLVKVFTINAADEKEALRTLKSGSKNIPEHRKKIQTYMLNWGETPDSNVVETRNGVLSEFLVLMQQVIELPPDTQLIFPPPSNVIAELPRPTIITPPQFQREEPKHETDSDSTSPPKPE